MSNFDCSKDDYLMVWLGLVGGCVGLWVPKEMAMDQASGGSYSAPPAVTRSGPGNTANI